MPSLRRTFSCSAVRTSPYHPSTSAYATRAGGSNPRRVSGSDIQERRVLQDLDWWRVEEGQRELRGYSPADFLDQQTNAVDPEEEQEQIPPEVATSTLAAAPAAVLVAMNTTSPLLDSLPGGGADVDEGHVPFYMGVHFTGPGLTEVGLS